MKKVMAFGTFDHFHAGHESYLKQAKALGDALIVVVSRDATVKKIKGEPPDLAEKKRLAAIKQTGLADKITLGELGDKYKIIKQHKPNIIALGYDQFAFTFRLEKFIIDNKLDSKIVRMKPYKPAVYKTSLLREAAAANPI